MKKPTPPTKPKAPKEPSQVYTELLDYSIDLFDMTLQDVLVKIAEIGRKIETFSGLTRKPLGSVDPKDVKFEYNSYDEVTKLIWKQPVEIILTHEEFERQKAKYLVALSKYRSKMEEYEIRKAQYESDLKEYLGQKRKQIEEQERKAFAALKQKYGDS